MEKMLGMCDKKSMCTRAGKEAEMAFMWLWRKRNEDGGMGNQFQAEADQLSWQTFRGCHGSTETTKEEGYHLKIELGRPWKRYTKLLLPRKPVTARKDNYEKDSDNLESQETARKD
jgi:hypothetical protein